MRIALALSACLLLASCAGYEEPANYAGPTPSQQMLNVGNTLIMQDAMMRAANAPPPMVTTNCTATPSGYSCNSF